MTPEKSIYTYYGIYNFTQTLLLKTPRRMIDDNIAGFLLEVVYIFNWEIRNW